MGRTAAELGHASMNVFLRSWSVHFSINVFHTANALWRSCFPVEQTDRVSSHPFPAVYSTLTTGALAQVLRTAYTVGADLSVQLLRRNIGDTYLVTGVKDGQRAILRVYRSGWRTQADVAWELNFIEYVSAGGVSVARPIPQADGRLFGVLNALEGPRFYALFGFLPGRALTSTPEEAALYGAVTATLHNASEDFPAGQRFALDLDHLITAPMAKLRPLLAEFPEQAEALEHVAASTLARLSELAPELTRGACHGDLHEINARLHEGRVSLFDFDCGGPGFLAYDLAVYWWSQVSDGGPSDEASQVVWDVYLGAYQARRPLSGADRAALPHFVTARSLWFMGLMAGRVDEFGSETLGQPFFDYGVNFMRGWSERISA